MDLLKLPKLKLSIVAALVTLLLAVTMGCGAQSSPTPAATSAPPPTPTPELSLDDLVSRASENLKDLSTARFFMTDEFESGQTFFGMKLKSVEGDLKSPDSFKMLVNVETPNFGFVVIEMRGVGEEAFMKFSEDSPWSSIPPDQVPFNFGEMGVTLSELVTEMRDPTLKGVEEVQGVPSFILEGNVVSEEMSKLIRDLEPGNPVTLTYWFDEADLMLQQFRIGGKLFEEDAPGTSRLVVISDLNAPLEIQVPEIASGS